MAETVACQNCKGTGLRYDSGDLHRSPGMIPCGQCVRGRVTKAERKVPRYDQKIPGDTNPVAELYDDKGATLAEALRQTLRRGKPKEAAPPGPFDLMLDSGDRYLEHLDDIAREDAAGLRESQKSYGNSWKSRGGVGAYMMLARKADRLDNRVKRMPANGGSAYDIFMHVFADQRAEGVIDDVRDLRRYLMLVEAEMRARGFRAVHRDNK